MGKSIQKRKTKKVLDKRIRGGANGSRATAKTEVKPVVVSAAPKPIIRPMVIAPKVTKHKPVHLRVFYYFEPIWTGRDGKVSLRAIMAIIMAWKMIENFDFAVQKWEAGRAMGDLVGGLWVFALLIAGLLSITMYQNVQFDRAHAESQAPPPLPAITVQQAENVTGGQTIAEAGTVNTENIENVNMQKGSVEGG